MNRNDTIAFILNNYRRHYDTEDLELFENHLLRMTESELAEEYEDAYCESMTPPDMSDLDPSNYSHFEI